MFKRILLGIGAASALSLVGCGPAEEGDDADDIGTVGIGDDGKEDSAQSIALAASRSVSFSFNATTAPLIVTVDCGQPADPDTVGPVFVVKAPDLGIATTSSEPPRAGFWRWAGKLAAKSHSVTITNRGPAANCKVTVTKQRTGATCNTWTQWRSPNVNHTHFRVGSDTSSDWETFPTSGNHWGAWAAWGLEYTKPVLRPYLMHGLEHGGVVYSYKCASKTAGTCTTEATALIGVINANGDHRVVLTPDPTQPKNFAIRAWRWGMSGECLDDTVAKAFAKAHIRHGREDTDADPPVPFDPTTKNVPCDDLMAAPDSCN